MKNAKIVLVAEWDGWCGACAAERPLVLTRTGRQRLRTWLTGADDDSRPLVLTCRLCGTGVDVPLERDDPPVVGTPQDLGPVLAWPTTVDEPPSDELAITTELPVAVRAVAPDAALVAGRQAVAGALGALLAQRTAAAPAPRTSLVKTPVVAPVVPLQRIPSSGGLAELQLLAEGIDLLSTGRA